MKKKKIKSAKQKEQSQKGPTKNFFIGIVRKNYFPYLVIIVLAFLYFAPGLFSSTSMYTTDGALQGDGSTGGSFQDLRNLFEEKDVWRAALGGMPTGITLNEYIRIIFIKIFIHFLYDYKVHFLYMIFLTALAGICMYLLLKNIGIGTVLATALSVGYQFSPHFMTFTYAGHFSKMGVIAILPLLFLLLKRGLDTGKLKYFAWLALCMGIDIFFTHLQYVYFSFLVLGLYFVYRIVSEIITLKQLRAPVIKSVFFVLAVAFGMGLGARGYVPQYFHTTTESKRAGDQGQGLDIDYASSWSLHAEEIASLLVPEFGHYDTGGSRYYWGKNFFKLNADYFGGIIFLLSFLSLFLFKRNGMVRFFFLVFIVSLLFTLGSSTYVFTLMYHILPGMKSFRAPSFMIFVTAFAGFVLSGVFLQYLLDLKSLNTTRLSGLTILVIAGICFVFALEPDLLLSPWRALFYQNLSGDKLQLFEANIPELSKGLFFSSFIFVLIGLGIYLCSKKVVKPLYVSLILLPVFIADFWSIDKDFLNYQQVTPAAVLAKQQDPVYEFIKDYDSSPYYRVMPLNLSIQDRVPDEDITFISGFHDFVMRRYDTAMKSLNNQNLLNFVNLANGKFLVTPQELPPQFFQELTEINGLRVYRNDHALPWFYVRNRILVDGDENNVLKNIFESNVDLNTTIILESEPPERYANFPNQDNVTVDYSIDILNYDPSQGNVELNVTLDKPGFFVYSENFHPGWQCTVDGEKQDMYRANYLFKGVFLDEGEHEVVFTYQNPLIEISRIIMMISIVMIGGALSLLYFRQTRSSKSKEIKSSQILGN
jgi:hypothetical protein